MPLVQVVLSIGSFLAVCFGTAAALTAATVAMARLEPAKVPACVPVPVPVRGAGNARRQQ